MAKCDRCRVVYAPDPAGELRAWLHSENLELLPRMLVEGDVLELRETLAGSRDDSATLARWFDVFWKEWPDGHRVNRRAAELAFGRLRGLDEKLLALIVADLRIRKQSFEWRKQNGQFIPHAATYLRGERWKDEYAVGKTGLDVRGRQLAARATILDEVASYLGSRLDGPVGLDLSGT